MLQRSHFRKLTEAALLSSSSSLYRPIQLFACRQYAPITRHLRIVTATKDNAIGNIRWKSSSTTRWKKRQETDFYAREAKVEGLKSRAAFKLIQVAVHLTQPNGRVVGVDVIPAPPPKGASSIMGNFLAPGVQSMVRNFLSTPDLGRPKPLGMTRKNDDEPTAEEANSYIDDERHDTEGQTVAEHPSSNGKGTKKTKKKKETEEGNDIWDVKKVERNTTDVVLSDMCEPWPLVDGWWKPHIKIPHTRMMNVSGIRSRDHMGSMDLANAALQFCIDVLKANGSFVCKFYQGSEDKILEERLKMVFNTIHIIKPESSRDESREAYFVGLRKKVKVDKRAVMTHGLQPGEVVDWDRSWAEVKE